MEIINLETSFTRLKNFLDFSVIPMIIKSAIEISLFEVLAREDKTLEEILEETKTDSLITKYLIEVLVCLNLLIKKDNYYSLSLEAKEFLCKDSPNNQLFPFKNFKAAFSPYQNLTAKLKNETIQSKSKKGWDSPEMMQLMRQSSKSGSVQDIFNFTSEIPNFQNMKKMCDLGGNSGYYSLAFLAANKNLEAHIFDMPEVCKQAEILNKDDDAVARLFFHGQNLEENFDIGKDYDLVFTSHFLYRKNADNLLEEFFTSINKVLKLGGVFISNHFGDNLTGDGLLNIALIDLRTSLAGLKSHQISQENLKQALQKAGFGNFKICEKYTNQNGLHSLIFMAEKVEER